MENYLLGQLLLHENLITKDQLAKGLETQRMQPLHLGEIFCNEGIITRDDLIKALQMQINLFSEDITQLRRGNDDSICSSLLENSVFLEHSDAIIRSVEDIWRRFKLTTNISILDIQHIWLLFLTSYAGFVLRTKKFGNTLEYVQGIYQLLLMYTREHFSIEEELIKIINDDAGHYNEHAQFINEVNKRMIAATKQDSAGCTDSSQLLDLCGFLNDWIVSHIAIKDKAFTILLKNGDMKVETLAAWVNTLKSKYPVKINKYQKQLYERIKIAKP